MIEIKNKSGRVIHQVDDDVLAGADLSHAELLMADFNGGSLYRTNFERAQLAFASFRRADLVRMQSLTQAIECPPTAKRDVTLRSLYRSSGV